MRLHLTPHTISEGTIALTSSSNERKRTTLGACQVWFEFLSAAGKKHKEDNMLNVPMPPCPGSSADQDIQTIRTSPGDGQGALRPHRMVKKKEG